MLLQYIFFDNISNIIHSGDQDSVVPFTATRTIVDILAKQSKLITMNTYATWYDNKQVSFGLMFQ